MSERIGQARHKPVGDWVQTTMVVSIAGIQFRKRDVEAFVKAVRQAEFAGLRYGVRLEHQPRNEHDPNAIAVFGQAETKGWFRSGLREWHIGFLDRDTACELVRDLLARGISIAGELYQIYVGDEGFIDVKVIVLAPPGHSMKKRLSI